MKFADHLSGEQKKQLEKITSPKKNRKKKPEKLSRKDLAELMGVNRDRFTRGKGGAIRRQ